MKSKIFFPNLDGFRFLAFMLVFWQHASEPLVNNLKTAGIISDDQLRYFVTGGLGVSFFFVLSGFLITYLLMDEKIRNGTISKKAFYIRRVLRIFPLYYLVVIWGFAIYPLVRTLFHLPPVDNGSFPLYAVFLVNFDTIYSQTDHAGFLSVLWSVSIEEQFYLVWAFLLAYLPISSYKFLFVLLIVASTFFRFLNADNEKVIYFHTFSVVSDLAVGGGVAYLAISHKKFTHFFEELNRFYIILIYLIGFTVIWFYPSLFYLDNFVWLQRLVFTLFFAFIIAEQNYGSHSFFKMENWKIISRLGIYTYGLYSLHMIVLYFLDLGFRGLQLDQERYYVNFLFIVLGLGGSIAVSYLCYVYFEQRFLRLKRYFTV